MGEGYAGQTESVCPYCGKPVDVDTPGVTYARDRLEVPSVDGLPNEIEGRGAFFHTGCPPEAIGWVRRSGWSEAEQTYSVRVFSPGDFSLGGAEYRSATPPKPGDEIDVRMLHGNTDTWGAMPLANVRVISVDKEELVIKAHMISPA